MLHQKIKARDGISVILVLILVSFMGLGLTYLVVNTNKPVKSLSQIPLQNKSNLDKLLYPLMEKVGTIKYSTFFFLTPTVLPPLITPTLIIPTQPSQCKSGGAIQLDKVSQILQNTSTNHITLSHTINAQPPCTILLVGVTSEDIPTSVTYNSLHLTKIADRVCQRSATAGSPCIDSVYYLISPPIGTYTLVVNISTSHPTIVGAVSFNNVNQTNPFGNLKQVSGQNNASVSVSTSINQLVFDSFSSMTQYNPDPSQSQLWNVKSPSIYSGGASTKQANSTTTGMKWTGNDGWAEIVIPLNPI